MDLNEQDLIVIEAKYMLKDGIKECFYQMLLKWRLKTPENCVVSHLYEMMLSNTHLFQQSSVNKIIDSINNRLDKINEFNQNIENKLQFYIQKASANDSLEKKENLSKVNKLESN